MSANLRDLGLLRITAVTPEVIVGDVNANLSAIKAALDRAVDAGCQVIVFPELAVTGYSCGDLFYQTLLLDKVEEGLLELARYSRNLETVLVVGAPLRQAGRLFNTAVVINSGRIVGIVPKTFLPNTLEFYEERWFSSSVDAVDGLLSIDGIEAPFGTDLLFGVDGFPGAVLGIEICEDGWVASPPSGQLAAAGATVLLNLSASPETLGKCAYRQALVEAQSARCLAAYIYASAGPGESSTDLVFSGHCLIAENGQLLAETERFQFETGMAIADVDIERLTNERLRNNSYAMALPEGGYEILSLIVRNGLANRLLRPVPRTPFVPSSEGERHARCQEIFAIQTTGLMKRLKHTGSGRVVVGISGGLDSTLALLVTVKAFDRLGLPRSGILAVTMPGFGTTERTRNNATELAKELGVSLKTISIDAAVTQHFADIAQDPDNHDITYENSQARERTQILMDLANQAGGLVIGTGDLSELALGWCTYNGDHMSMYGVNASIPKTLVRYLIDWCAEVEFSGAAAAILEDICATPVSPELLPPDEDGMISQKTEEHVGPYELHDFFLFQVVRCHFAPLKVLHLACQAFAEEYTREEICRWLKLFYQRFFAQQFKRSCLPDGPKVGSVALSPRGDWRMPSDASAALWLAELEQLEEEERPAVSGRQ
ncbi:MAG: NAD(+) synthase [Desulfuromonadales bacterium]|nr:NAD(+) synthase [Desulfuromonadales bacterium]